MTFQEWLKGKGDLTVATMLGVSRYTARSWRLGTRFPRKEEARKLAAIEPSMTLDVIYAPRGEETARAIRPTPRDQAIA